MDTFNAWSRSRTQVHQSC